MLGSCIVSLTLLPFPLTVAGFPLKVDSVTLKKKVAATTFLIRFDRQLRLAKLANLSQVLVCNWCYWGSLTSLLSPYSSVTSHYIWSLSYNFPMWSQCKVTELFNILTFKFLRQMQLNFGGQIDQLLFITKCILLVVFLLLAAPFRGRTADHPYDIDPHIWFSTGFTPDALTHPFPFIRAWERQ